MDGLFVTFEGTEGSGKSTQIQLLEKRLLELKRTVLTVREPGGTRLGEEIRHLLKYSSSGAAMSPETELLLMNASRAQLVREVLRPALREGKIVLCDRYFDSTIAYQVYGRNLDPNPAQRIIDFAIDGVRPDLTLLLRVPLEVSESRRASRSASCDGKPDRLEMENRAFFERVEKGYDAIASNTATRVRSIDATQGIEQVHAEVWRWVEAILCSPATSGERAWKTVGEYRMHGPG
ncbi:MAG TPA: dTMP kinase [Verrucomicrobiae bacterium]|nr:dTMP kinase [Verrucomicrobiae bacterium]